MRPAQPRLYRQGNRAAVTQAFSSHHENIPIDEITPAHINRVIDKLLRRTPSEANHAFGVIRKFFSWTKERGMLAYSPCDGMKMPARKNSRDRFLDDEELAQVFATARSTGYPYGNLVQLLLLTGQRRSEIVGLKWSWIDDVQKPSPSPKTSQRQVSSTQFLSHQ